MMLSEPIQKRKLPHDDFPLTLKSLIVKILILAWQRIEADLLPKTVKSNYVDEVKTTTRLQKAIGKILDNSEMQEDTSTLVTPIRGMECENYNGESLEKRPDLTFKVHPRREGVAASIYDGLFIECKPIDPNRKLKEQYINKGINRFVNGDYAWAMPCGMMLGYVIKNYKTPEDLSAILREEEHTSENLKEEPIETTVTYQSKHKRDWKYPATNTKPGEIGIQHLWLYYSS